MTIKVDEIIHGHGSLSGIVSVEARSNGSVDIWQRVNGEIKKTIEKFEPFCLVKDLEIANILKKDGRTVDTLQGDLPFRYKVSIKNINKKKLTELFGDDFDIRRDERFYSPNLVEQYLISSGNAYYKELTFDDVIRMAIHIESTGVDPENNKILSISILTNRDKKIFIDGLDEYSTLKKLVSTVQEIDPDIIESYGIFNSDLDFLVKRFFHHRIAFDIGRMPVLPDFHPYMDTFSSNNGSESFQRYHIPGREVVDTEHLCKRYNSISRAVKSVNLKDMAQYFKVESMDGGIIGEKLEKNINSILSVLKEVQGITDILLRDRFELVKLVPIRFEKICTCGNTKIIEYPLIRYYLKNNYSIPDKSYQRKYKGAEPRVLNVGYYENICKIDVVSMYPSIMIAKDYGPNYNQKIPKDHLNIFINRLEIIKKIRLEHKAKAKLGKELTSKATEKALKIIINASYGYLGSPDGMFNNYDSAEIITAYARDVVNDIEKCIANQGCLPLETDTDGVICKLSNDLSPIGLEHSVNKFLTKSHPCITVEAESKKAWGGIFIYAAKSYAYLDEENNLKIVGGSLRSKIMPIYFEKFISEMLDLVLRGDIEKFKKTFRQNFLEIESGKVSIEKIAKSDELNMSLDDYRRESSQRKIGDKSILQRSIFEALLKANKKDVKMGSMVTHYKSIEGEKITEAYLQDYDVKYYSEILVSKAWMFRACFDQYDYANFVLYKGDNDLRRQGKTIEDDNLELDTPYEIESQIVGHDKVEKMKTLVRLNLELDNLVQYGSMIRLTDIEFEKNAYMELKKNISGFNLQLYYSNEYDQNELELFLDVDLKKWPTPSFRSFGKQENFNYFIDLLLKELRSIKSLSDIVA